MPDIAIVDRLRHEIVTAPQDPATFKGPLQALIGLTIGAIKPNRPSLNIPRFIVDDNKTKPLNDPLVSIFVDGAALAALEGYNLLGNLQGYGGSLCFAPVSFDQLAERPRRITNIADRLLVMYGQTKTE